MNSKKTTPSKAELDKIRRNSDMGDPDVWKCTTICSSCLNRVGGGCDVVDALYQLEAQTTGKCEFYLKKNSK